MSGERVEPLTAADIDSLRDYYDGFVVDRLGRQVCRVDRILATIDARAGTVDVDDFRGRVETNLRVYEQRVGAGRGTDFDKGKAAAFRVVLSMLEPRREATFSCGRGLGEPR